MLDHTSGTCKPLILDTRVSDTMSLIEPRLSDLRAGFGGGYGFTGNLGMPPSPAVPLWRPPPTTPVSWCTIPACPCALSISRAPSYSLADLYEYSLYTGYSWPAWYLKAAAAQDPVYKGLSLPPPLPVDRLLPEPHPEHVDTADLRQVEPDDHRSSPGKELPTRQFKSDRVKERQDRTLSKPPKYDKELMLTHRQPGTQSQGGPGTLSTHYHNGDVTSSESFNLHHHPLVSQPSHLRTSPPPHPPPRYPHPPVEAHHEGPLNLSISNSTSMAGRGSPGRHSPTQSRPSVITCATGTQGGRFDTNSNGSASPAHRESGTDICDPAIEEHFRRSLKNYPEYLVKQPSVTPSPPPPPPPPPSHYQVPPPPPPALRQPSPMVPRNNNSSTGSMANSNVSITGSVDDHFARALGDSTWSALKAKADPVEAPTPGSVDDHFAKALGDTWLKIKAERESPRGPPPPFPLHQLPHPLAHPIGHPHALPHPLPQRSASPPTQPHNTSLLST